MPDKTLKDVGETLVDLWPSIELILGLHDQYLRGWSKTRSTEYLAALKGLEPGEIITALKKLATEKSWSKSPPAASEVRRECGVGSTDTRKFHNYNANRVFYMTDVERDAAIAQYGHCPGYVQRQYDNWIKAGRPELHHGCIVKNREE